MLNILKRFLMKLENIFKDSGWIFDDNLQINAQLFISALL